MSAQPRLVGFFTVDGQDVGSVSGDTTEELMGAIVGKLLDRGGALGDSLIAGGRGELTSVLGASQQTRAEMWGRFAAAYVWHHGATGPNVVAVAADDLMKEYDARFPEDLDAE